MANRKKDLVVQTYEVKLANTLRVEKYDLQSLKRNQQFLDALEKNSLKGGVISLAYKFYNDQIQDFYEEYIEKFNELILPLIFERGLNFSIPEEEIRDLIETYDRKINKQIEKIQVLGRIKNDKSFNRDLIYSTWSVALDGVQSIPFLLALDSRKIIVTDEKFNMDMSFFASLGAIPDIRQISRAGNITFPPNTFSINLQIMLNNEFRQVSILLLKQKPSNLGDFIRIMTNVSLVVDTKSYLDTDFSGIKWIKNSLRHSLFKKKYFLPLASVIRTGGMIIDKAVSPMQIKNIQSMRSNVNLDIGYEINKIGTIQYSVITKTANYPLVYDEFDKIICRGR